MTKQTGVSKLEYVGHIGVEKQTITEGSHDREVYFVRDSVCDIAGSFDTRQEAHAWLKARL